MWIARELERVQNRDATRLRLDQLVADGRVVSSTVELARWDEPEVHVDGCTYCGGDDVSGSWIALRRVERRVFFIPAFASLERALRGAHPDLTPPPSVESAPPPFMLEAGVVVFDEAALRAALPELPRAIPPLDRREVAQILQLELAPAFGAFPSPVRADRPRFVAGPGASLEAELDRLDATLERWTSQRGSIRIRERADDDEVRWFHVDDRDAFPLVQAADGALHLHFEPGLVFELLC